MKRTLFVGILVIFIGSFVGRALYKNNISKSVFKTNNSYYFLQEGVYSNEDIMRENVKNLSNKLITRDNNKYYVYLGITKSLDNALKIEKLYKDKGYEIYRKEINISNLEFSNNVDQFDKLIEETDDISDVLTIEEVVLSNYDELINSNK